MFDSKYTGRQIEELLEQAGNDLVTAGEDENYVVKVVDAEGTVLAGFKESGEIAVPIGLADDAYTLIYALYEKLGNIIPAVQDWVSNNFTNADNIKQLIDSDTDSTYVMKFVDSEGNVLQGFKTNGEACIPSGISDDAYNLIISLYRIVAGIVPSMQDYTGRTFATNALIDSGADEDYALKMIDANGNLLQGFKQSGEVSIPNGVSDDTYTLLTNLCRVVKGLANIVGEIKERIDN